MKERPIIFSAPMVCAILTDDKTQTRRVIKDERILIRTGVIAPQARLYRSEEMAYRCPYGRVGDHLWVKEGLAVGAMPNLFTGEPMLDFPIATYRADGAAVLSGERDGNFDIMPWWRGDTLSPLFLPRWASRITLEITNVCVQPLTAITENDAQAEGFADIAAFMRAFTDLNDPKGKRWPHVPWVWALTFHRVPQEDRVAA